MAACRASSTGLCSSLLSTSVPTRRVVVTSAALTRGVNGSGRPEVVGRSGGWRSRGLRPGGPRRATRPGDPVGTRLQGEAEGSRREAPRYGAHAPAPCVCHDPRPPTGCEQLAHTEGSPRMHIPDGFIDARTSAGGRRRGGRRPRLLRSGRDADARRQAGPDGRAGGGLHLRRADAQLPGGLRHQRPPARRRAGRGPRRALASAALCVAVVLLVQALLFADGGLSALGLNVVNMALVTAFGGYAVFLLLRRVLPGSRGRRGRGRPGSPAFASVVAASVAFGVEYAARRRGLGLGRHGAGGHGRRARRSSASARASSPALTVGAVLAVRPDLVYGARDLRPELELRPAGVASMAPAAARVAIARLRRRLGLARRAGAGLLREPRASSQPDGLEQGRRATRASPPRRGPRPRRRPAGRLRDRGRRRRAAVHRAWPAHRRHGHLRRRRRAVPRHEALRPQGRAGRQPVAASSGAPGP